MQNNSGIWPLPLPTSLFDMQPDRLGTAFLSHHPLTQNTSSNISASTLSLENLLIHGAGIRRVHVFCNAVKVLVEHGRLSLEHRCCSIVSAWKAAAPSVSCTSHMKGEVWLRWGHTLVPCFSFVQMIAVVTSSSILSLMRHKSINE